MEITVLKIIRCLNEGEDFKNHDLKGKEVKKWVAAFTYKESDDTIPGPENYKLKCLKKDRPGNGNTIA